MNVNKAILKAITFTSAVILSAYTNMASADNTPMRLKGLKVAIIKDAIGSKELITGNYNQGVAKLTIVNEQNESEFERAMGLCVANLKTNKFLAANKACSMAIDKINLNGDNTSQSNYLKSLAYSNRGILRYVEKDGYGALLDFTTALLLNDNDIVKQNIMHAKKALSSQNNSGTNLAKLQ